MISHDTNWCKQQEINQILLYVHIYICHVSVYLFCWRKKWKKKWSEWSGVKCKDKSSTVNNQVIVVDVSYEIPPVPFSTSRTSSLHTSISISTNWRKTNTNTHCYTAYSMCAWCVYSSGRSTKHIHIHTLALIKLRWTAHSIFRAPVCTAQYSECIYSVMSCKQQKSYQSEHSTGDNQLSINIW